MESTPNIAYTRFVLERGMAGDLIDLNVALATCIIGYAVSARWLQKQSFLKLDNNPYADWIAMYSGDEFQSMATAHQQTLDTPPFPDELRVAAHGGQVACWPHGAKAKVQNH